MDKREYLARLGQRLKSLPPGEVRDALDFYDGYISDSGDEAAAIAQLGPPDEVAAQIVANYVTWRNSADVPHTKTMGIKATWGVLIVLLSPVALPLAAAAFVLAIALFITIFFIGVSGVACVIFGIIGILAVPFAVVQHIGYALALAGSGVFALGIGLILVETTRTLWRVSVNGLVKMTRSLNKKGGK